MCYQASAARRFADSRQVDKGKEDGEDFARKMAAKKKSTRSDEDTVKEKIRFSESTPNLGFLHSPFGG